MLISSLPLSELCSYFGKTDEIVYGEPYKHPANLVEKKEIGEQNTLFFVILQTEE